MATTWGDIATWGGGATDGAETISAFQRNVKDYGALGNGSTNDAAAITAAITAAGANGTVVWPTGTYKINSTIAALTGQKWLATGNAKITTATNGISMVAVVANTTFDGLWIDSTATVGHAGLDWTTGAGGVTVRNCKFTGMYQQCINMNATGLVNTVIADNLFDGTNYCVLTNSTATDLRNLRITNNTIINGYADGIELNHPTASAYSKAKYVTITGNYVSVSNSDAINGGFGIGIAGASYVTITGNTIVGCSQQGIHFENYTRDLTITGNTLIDNCVWAGAGTFATIYGLEGKNITITGNVIRNTGRGGNGIEFGWDASNAVHDATIANNVITASANDGIKIGGQIPPSNIQVLGNTVSGNGGHGIEFLGYDDFLTPLGAGDYSKISNNLVYGNTGAWIYLDVKRGKNGMMIDRNSLYGNAGGDISEPYTDSALVIHGASGQATIAAVPTNTTPAAVNVLNMAKCARGTLTVTATSDWATGRAVAVYDLKWDGTTLTATLITEFDQPSNRVTTIAVSQAGGWLKATAHWTATGTTNLFFDAHLDGVVLL